MKLLRGMKYRKIYWN